MTGSKNDFAHKLGEHLKTSFNIRAWDESDTRNNGLLLNATGYELEARLNGRKAAQEKAEEYLQALGHEIEGDGNPSRIMEARNDARAVAAAVISFCHGPKGLH